MSGAQAAVDATPAAPPSPPGASFDAAGARQAGYSDSEIAGFLAPRANFDLDAAHKAGYSDTDVANFLAQPKAATAAPAMGSGTPGPDFDPTSQPFARDDQSPSDLGPAAGRIANAAVQGWQDTPSPLTPEAEAAVNDYGGPIGRQIINPGLKLAAGVVPGPWNPTMNAGMAAISRAATEAFGEKGGRDALALLASAPMLHGEVPKVPDVAAPPVEVASATPMFDQVPAQTQLSPYEPVTAMQVAARDGIGIDDAYRRAGEENRAGAAAPTPAATADSIMAAPDIGSAIDAATTAVQAPAPAIPAPVARSTLFATAEQLSPLVDAGPDALARYDAEQASPPGWARGITGDSRFRAGGWIRPNRRAQTGKGWPRRTDNHG